jgi:putative DNA primase/helicase
MSALKPRRQRLAAHLHRCGPRPVLEALIAVESGQPLDEVLHDFARLQPEIYEAVGAAVLPIDEVTVVSGDARRDAAVHREVVAMAAVGRLRPMAPRRKAPHHEPRPGGLPGISKGVQFMSSLKRQLLSAKTVAAVERLARSDQRLAATVDQWDRDPWLLNTPAGTVELKTGEMREHRKLDYITKIAATSPGGACPRWRAFIGEITGHDSELGGFIQRMLGYALTGSTQEQCLFFLYGTGANGKSVLLSTVAAILADYHTTAPIETFTASASERHPTELAGLRGARLVTAIETEEGRRWAEAKIKSLTGGDPIAARFMRGDFFEFTPQFKLIIAGNHRPALRTVDEAMRRRFHLVPFTVTIAKDERDPNLTEKLKAEWGGILAWMIDGCLMWQRDGLNPPAAVRDATAAYLEAEDAIAAWLADCTARDPNAWTNSTALFGSWSGWATKAGESIGTQKAFSQRLENRDGIALLRRKDGRGFQGIRIDPVYADDQR